MLAAFCDSELQSTENLATVLRSPRAPPAAIDAACRAAHLSQTNRSRADIRAASPRQPRRTAPSGAVDAIRAGRRRRDRM